METKLHQLIHISTTMQQHGQIMSILAEFDSHPFMQRQSSKIPRCHTCGCAGIGRQEFRNDMSLARDHPVVSITLRIEVANAPRTDTVSEVLEHVAGAGGSDSQCVYTPSARSTLHAACTMQVFAQHSHSLLLPEKTDTRQDTPNMIHICTSGRRDRAGTCMTMDWQSSAFEEEFVFLSIRAK